MSKLITAETFYNQDGIMGVPDNGTAILPALWANYRFPSMDPIPPNGYTPDYSTDAFVNEGRWMANCPFGCGSAQVVAETDHRFYCCGQMGCQNFEVKNQTVAVNWPDAATQAAIEELLIKRPPVFRNWTPDESLEQLLSENVQHGIEA